MSPKVTKVAVCVSGGVASSSSFDAFHDSLAANVFAPNMRSCEFHLFYFVRLPNGFGKERLEAAVAALSSGHAHVWMQRLLVEDESNCKDEAAILLDHPHYSYQAPFEFNQFNTLSMYWKIHQVDRLRTNYEAETGVPFHAVVRIRPDLLLHEALELDPPALSPRVILLPWFNSSMRLAFDQLAIGPPEAMRAYAKAYYNVPYLTQEFLRLGFHPEHVLFMHLSDMGIGIRRIRCRTSIARKADTGQGYEVVDSYARLKTEFGASALEGGEGDYASLPGASSAAASSRLNLAGATSEGGREERGVSLGAAELISASRDLGVRVTNLERGWLSELQARARALTAAQEELALSRQEKLILEAKLERCLQAKDDLLLVNRRFFQVTLAATVAAAAMLAIATGSAAAGSRH